MRWSLTSSILMHVAILVAAFVVLPNPNEFEVKPQDSIPVDIVTDAMLGKRMAMVKDAEPPKPDEKVAPKKSDPVKPVEPQPEIDDKIKVAAKEQSAPDPVKEKPKEEPPPPKPAEKPPEPKPEPKKAETKPLDPDPLKDLIKTTDEEAELQAKLEEEKKAEEKKLAEEKTKAEEQKKLEEKKKAEAKAAADAKKKADEKKKAELAKAEAKKKKKELNLDEIAALLDNTNDKKTAPQKPSAETGSPKTGQFNVQGTDDSLSATLADMLNKRFVECWNVPPAVQNSKMSVEVQFQLNKDGTVSSVPRVLNSSADPVFAAMAQSAVSAVQGCGPYDFLPADHYDLWQDVVVDFNPSKMFGT